MIINDKFKNSLFVSLFSEPALLRKLYCALEDVSVPEDTPVIINTLENVLYMDFNNDISFEIGGKLVVLIEHQSTINPNIALRLLIYVTRILEKRTKGSTLYSKTQLTIPSPEFFVLYNGTAPFSDNSVVRLSDLFADTKDLGLPERTRPLLELEVKIININEGRNAEVVNRCRELAEYSAFIDKVRSFLKELDDLKKAMKAAIKYCAKHDIMKEYLEIHGSEVLNMLLEEWNMEDAIAYARKEEREEGIAIGMELGVEKGRIEERQHFAELLDKGLSIEEIKKQLYSD